MEGGVEVEVTASPPASAPAEAVVAASAEQAAAAAETATLAAQGAIALASVEAAKVVQEAAEEQQELEDNQEWLEAEVKALAASLLETKEAIRLMTEAVASLGMELATMKEASQKLTPEAPPVPTAEPMEQSQSDGAVDPQEAKIAPQKRRRLI